MQVRRFHDAAEFYTRVEPYLLAHEAEHNLILGLCTTLIKTDMYREPYLAFVEKNGEIVAVALRTPPHKLILSRVKEDGALALLVEDVRAVYRELPGVGGPKEVSRQFAERWQSRFGKCYRMERALRIYRLETVKSVHNVPGEARPVSIAERELLIEWLMAFSVEAVESMAREEAERAVDIRLETNSDIRGLRVWCDKGRPVSMAGYTGPTPNGIRIGPVYTPPEYRRRGYASALTAAVSQEMLERGHRFCFLFTDLSNPTSNHIYQAIGYEPVCDVDEYRFEN